jgi:dienelactone hydrolase
MVGRTLEYKDGATTLKGFIAYDESKAGARPGVILYPEAFGVGPHVIDRAKRLAALGYIALAADPYGNGATAGDLPKAREMMTAVRSDVAVWRQRAQASLDALVAQPQTDKAKIAAIGHCFGGSTALELARSGAAVGAVVSFHGGLESPRPQDAANIRGKVLVCHGALDPLIPLSQVTAFEEQMAKTKVDWQVHVYGAAVHSFTNPDAGKVGNPALAYDADADRRSWAAMLDLFDSAFGKR